jgi:hypothetical protein
VYVETTGAFQIGQDIVLVYTSPAGFDFHRTANIVNLREKGIGVRFKHPGYNR